MWVAMRPRFDRCLQYRWEELSAIGWKPSNFIIEHKGMLALFHDVVDLEAVAAAGDDYGSVAEEIVRLRTNSDVCKSMLGTAYLKVMWRLFTRKVANMVDCLQANDFAVAELEGFERVMTNDTKNLLSEGVHIYDNSEKRSFTFIGSKVEVDAPCPDDQWNFAMEARKRSCAIGANDVRRLPWEFLVHGLGEIPNVPRACRVPLFISFAC